MPSRYFKYFLFVIPLVLSGCGPGWEAHRVDNVVPYGNTRTAGTGVAYVRAKMMPEKEIKVETKETVVEEKKEPPKESGEELKSAEPAFTKKQQK